jgi:rhodanese-related sulfurtransferase
MLQRVIAVTALSLMVAAGQAAADTAKGRIEHVSNKAQTIQIGVQGKDPVVVRVGPQTQFVNAEGLSDLGPPDLIKVEFAKGQPASRIEKVVFGLPEGVEIGIDEMLAILQGKRGPYFLGDARPEARYKESHIPSAQPTFPKDEAAFLAALPDQKDKLIVFYCGGPTCPFTGDAVEIASKEGYTNLKGFQAGIPGWKKAKLPVHASPAWLSKNLDEHHVVIDARPPAQAARSHIKGAVSMPAAQLAQMTQRFISTQAEARLPGLSDKSAPIVVYADEHTSREALIGFKHIRDWGYKNVSVLQDGFSNWVAKGYPVASGQMASSIVYSKKLAKGAIAPGEFAELEKSRKDVVFLDVRTDAEVAQEGKLKGAKHIPLDALEDKLSELPKGKEIITYCENGIRAQMASELLKDRGYETRFLNETIEFDAEGDYSL